MLPACAGASPVPTITTPPSSTVLLRPTSTRTDLPEASATITITSLPTTTRIPTLTPARTSTPTPTQFVTIPIVGEGTSIPAANVPITPANASQVVQLARLGKGTNNDMAYSPDGLVLAVASSPGIYLYDNNQKLLDVLPTDQFVHGIAFSPDGETLAVSVPVGNIQIWRWKERQLLKTIHVEGDYKDGYAKSLSFSPVGDSIGFVFFRAYPQIYVIQIESEKVLFRLANISDPPGVRFSPDGSSIYIVDGGIRIYRISDGEILGNMTAVGDDEDPLNNLAVSSDGEFIIASNQKTIYLFHANEPDPYASFDIPIDIYSGHWLYSAETCKNGPSGGGFVVQNYVLSPDNQFLAVADDKGGFQIRRTRDGALLKSTPPLNGVARIIYHPHQPLLAVSYGNGQIELFNTESLQVTGAITGHTEFNSLAFSPVRPDGSVYLASGAEDNLIRIWSLPNGRRVSNIEGAAVSVTFSPDGQFLAYGSKDWTIDLIHLTDGKRYPPRSGHLDYVEGLAFSPNGKMLVSGSRDCTLKIWQVNDGYLSLQHTVGGGDPYIGHIDNVVYSPDGVWIAASYFGSVYFYNTRTQELRNLEIFADSVSFSPDGRYFAITLLAPGSFGDDLLLRVYEFSSMNQVKEWQVSTVWQVVYSPDGKLFALGTKEGTIQLIDADSGKVLLTLSGAALSKADGGFPVVTDLQFSPDGRFLASNNNGVIRLWGLPKE